MDRYFNPAFIILLLFPFYFTYNLYTGNVYFSHNDYPGMYYPFRQWFLSRLMNFEFPVWNPYWGAGHEAVIWSTVTIDPYTILELIIGPRYGYYHLIQCMAFVMAGYYVFRKLKFDPWPAAASSLLFFMSPIVTYWYFHFIKTDLFIAHMFMFIFMVKWFETGQYRYVFLMGWSFFLGMFGTKIEFWFFEVVFNILLSTIAFFIMKPRKVSMVFIVWASILAAILAQSWQINLLLNALTNSGRLSIPHGLHNLFSLEIYRNLYLSFSDTELLPAALIGVLFFAGLQAKPPFRWLLILTGLVVSILFRFWDFSFIRLFVHSPVMFGALIASIMLIRNPSRKYLLSAWILFMLPAYYWCKPLINNDDATYLLRIAPVLFQGIWGFLVFMGCLQVHRYRMAKLAYLSVLMVFILQSQGQIILSYLFGYLWIPGRDNYLIDFSFIVIAAFGTTTYFRFKPLLIRLAPFIIIFAAYNNLYYAAFPQPIPGIANPLLNSKLPYDPFKEVPGLRDTIKKWSYLPYQRAIDTDIENKLPQNQGTFLLEHAGNATFYGSISPAPYRELINYYRYGIKPEDKVAGYPSFYSEKTISRLPKLNNGGFSNGLIYYSTVWITPPFELDLLRLLGVNHIITRDDGLIPPLVQKLKLGNVMKTNEFNTSELTDTLPRSFLVTNINQENLQDFKENMRPHIELEGAENPTSHGVYIARPASFLGYEPEYVAIQVESPSEGYLVLTDVFHPYWSAAVDGNVVEIIQAFHAFRGVKVPAGLHKVEFFCRVPYFKLAFFITFITIVICLAGTFYFWSKKVRPQYKYT
ncbi:MAG: hypothetical protein WA240_14615 [Nitrospirota bacterium]